ncbi:MAG: hypothetical protein HYY40_01015 [Bacteroidetes bacterium]|nr:hypothetical protein [Bacteroidota bacterium]
MNSKMNSRLKSALSISILIILGIILPGADGYSQKKAKGLQYVEEPRFKNHFYISPVQVFFKRFQAGYEHDFGDKSLLLIGKIILHDNGTDRQYGGGGEIQYRIFLSEDKEKPFKEVVDDLPVSLFGDGLYFSPFISYTYQTFEYLDNIRIPYTATSNNGQTYTSYEYSVSKHFDYVSTGSGGLLLGFRNSFYHGLLVTDFYFGGEIKVGNEWGNGSINRKRLWGPAYTGVLPRINLQIGINF